MKAQPASLLPIHSTSSSIIPVRPHIIALGATKVIQLLRCRSLCIRRRRIPLATANSNPNQFRHDLLILSLDMCVGLPPCQKVLTSQHIRGRMLLCRPAAGEATSTRTTMEVFPNPRDTPTQSICRASSVWPCLSAESIGRRKLLRKSVGAGAAGFSPQYRGLSHSLIHSTTHTLTHTPSPHFTHSL